MQRSLIFVAMTAMSALLTQGCKAKKAASDELLSLDNFVGASHRSNKCYADPSKKYVPSSYPLLNRMHFIGRQGTEMEVPLRNHMQNVVVNIPEQLQSFFVALGGNIVIADDAAATCKDVAIALNPASAKAKDLGEVSSCLINLPRTAKNGRILHAHFSPNLTEVHHNAMRVFGTLLTDIGPSESAAVKAPLQQMMNEVTKSFLIDLARSKVLKFDSLRDFLTEEDIKLIRKNAASGGSISAEAFLQGLSFSKKQSLDGWQLRKMTLIESFDSWFCNDWGAADEAVLASIASGDTPLAQLNKINNTRRVMKHLFPETYKVFGARINGVLSALKGGAALTSDGAVGFGLAGGSAEVAAAGGGDTAKEGFALGDYYDPNASKGWNMTTAFFGSIWDNTGGAVGNAYSSYSNHVQRNVDRAMNSGSGVIGGTFKGVTGGVSDTYTEDVAKPIAQRTERVFEQQMQGNGGDINSAFRNTLAVELLRPTGATAVTETAILGRRFDGSEYRDNFERGSEFFGGVGSMAGTAAAGVGMVPGLGNRMVAGGVAPVRAGIAVTEAEAAGNASMLRKIGVPEKYATQYSTAFENNAQITSLPKGSTVYRVGEGPGSWVTRQPVADPINNLALPGNARPQIQKLVTTRELNVLEGGVTPQPGWATPGNPKLGGSSQMYIPYDDVASGALRRTADNAIMSGTGAGIGAGTSVSTARPSTTSTTPSGGSSSTSSGSGGTGGFK